MSFGENFKNLGRMITRENYCEEHSRYYYKFCCDCLKKDTQRQKEEATEKEDICEGCAFNVVGCQSERFMAASCIPTYDTTLEEIIGIGEKKNEIGRNHERN